MSCMKLSHATGNVYAVHLASKNLDAAKHVKGIAAFEIDQMAESGMSNLTNTLYMTSMQVRVVVGVLSNVSNIDVNAMIELSKIGSFER